MTSIAPVLPRVVHVTTAHRANDVRIFERECRSLGASGRYEVYLAAAGTIPRAPGVNLVPLGPVPRSRGRRFTSGPRKAFGLSRALSADLWHFHDPELLPVALKLARSGQRVVWDAHEDYVEQLGEAGGKSWVPTPARGVVRRGTRAMLAAIDRHAAGIVAATPTIASGYNNPRTVVVGNEARLEDFASCVPDFAGQRLLFTGTVGAGHLFNEVVAAVHELPGVTLAVAGREPPPSLWEAAKARLGERIQHVGWLDRTDLGVEMGKAALGLATYANTRAYGAAAPTKLFEFCAGGLPVIASPNESNVRYLLEGRGGFLADGFTGDAIADVIRSALSDRNAWDLASQRGREWATSAGSWDASERRLLDLYEELLGV